MAGAQVDWRSKSGVCRYACPATAGSYHGPTMAATDREGSQRSSRDGITRRRRRSLVYLKLWMAFTEVRPTMRVLLIVLCTRTYKNRRFFLSKESNVSHTIFSSILCAKPMDNFYELFTRIALKMGHLDALQCRMRTRV